MPAVALFGAHGATVHSAPALVIQAASGVRPAQVAAVRQVLASVRPRIDRDFAVRDRPVLTVRIYAHQAGFARALHRLEGEWPQNSVDSTGNIAGGILPLGPASPVEAHNLAHVYTEWVIDRLTGNRRDRQPNPAWLYDGLAEWEAGRVGSSLPCRIAGRYPIPLSVLTRPPDWRRLRAGPFGSVAYCEARIAAARIVATVGLPRIAHLLHRDRSWPPFVRDLGLS